jgi:hypothetical protein
MQNLTPSSLAFPAKLALRLAKYVCTDFLFLCFQGEDELAKKIVKIHAERMASTFAEVQACIFDSKHGNDQSRHLKKVSRLFVSQAESWLTERKMTIFSILQARLTFFKLLASTLEENAHLAKPIGSKMLDNFFESVFEAGKAQVFDPALSTIW